MELRWGIIGLGKIANKFAKALPLASGNRLVAVASRSKEKAEAFAMTYQVSVYYANYELIFQDENVDIVYIATPHNSHKKYSIQAMQSGKHVLCEKPIAMCAQDALDMVACAKKHHVFLMEAMWTRFNPVIKQVLEACDSRSIGDINYLYADFSFNNVINENSRLYNAELGGGSLLDVGIYPAFLAYLFLGVPKRILATAILHTNGIDLQTNMIFEYEKCTANLMSGLQNKPEITARIHGSKGRIHIHERWHEANSYTLFGEEEQAQTYKLDVNNGYALEATACYESIKKGDIENDLWSHKNSVELMQILDKIRQQAGIKYPMN